MENTGEYGVERVESFHCFKNNSGQSWTNEKYLKLRETKESNFNAFKF